MALEAYIKIIEIGGIDFELVYKDKKYFSCTDCVFNIKTNVVKPYCIAGAQYCSKTNVYHLPGNALYVYTEEVNINHDLFKPNKLYKAERALASESIVYTVNEAGSDSCVILEGVSTQTNSQWFILKNPE